MFASKEEIIQDSLSESSSIKCKGRKRNKIHSPLTQSPILIKQDNVVSLFSAKTSNFQKQKQDEKSQTIESKTLSDMSDEIFTIEKSETYASKSETSKSYKDRIKNRFKNIKQQAGKSTKKANTHISSRSSIHGHIDQIRKESMQIDTEIQSLHKKNNVNEHLITNQLNFFRFINETAQDNKEQEKMKNFTINKVLPEKLGFNLKVSAKECCFIPESKSIDIYEKIPENKLRYPGEEGLYVNCRPSVPKAHLNILEHRLVSSGEKKWFHCDGTMDIISDPFVDRSVKPIYSHDISRNQLTLVTYKPPKRKNEIDCEEIVVVKGNILELYIEDIKFAHHPLFSTEHVLQEALVQLYAKYQKITESNILQKTKNHLESLQHVKKNAEILKNQSGDSANEIIVKYTEDIKKLRDTYLDESKQLRDTLKCIIDVWKSIKKLREHQKYSNTNVKLLIQKEKVDYLVEKTNHDIFFKQSLQDALNEYENTHKNKRIKNLGAGDFENLEDGESDATENSNIQKRRQLISERLERKLRKKFEECLKPPGEPNVKLLLTYDNQITSEVENPKEITRRQVVSSTKFGIKVLCNDIDVCKSKLKGLGDDFNLAFDESFSIQLYDVPDTLTIELVEYPKGLLKKKLCQIQVPLPSISLSSNKYHWEHFTKKDVVHYKHYGVGSGTTLNEILKSEKFGYDFNFPDSLNISKELSMSGVLKYKIKWEDHKNVSLEGSQSEDFGDANLDAVIDKNGVIDTAKLSEWVEKCVPDPQDPKNSILYEYIHLKDTWLADQPSKTYFRTSPFMEALHFCNFSEINSNLRFQILQLRNENELEFDNIVVPNRVKEIGVNLLADYKKRKSLEKLAGSVQQLNKEFEYLHDNDVEYEDVKNMGKKYIKQIHLKVFHMCKKLENNLDYDSVVNEKYLTYFEQLTKTVLRNFLNWFKWHPRLSVPLPLRKISDYSSDDRLQNTAQIKIFITIISARNVPCRLSDSVNKSENTVTEGHEVCPFIEISYKEFRSRTSSKPGRSCIWNETIIVPLESTDVDYLNVNSLSENISINLFDEVEKSTNTAKLTANWLGEVLVPASIFCSTTNIKGLFEVKSPHLLLGYQTEWYKQSNSNTSPKPENINSRTYVEMEFSILNPVPIICPNMADLPSNDTPYIKEYVLKWNQNFNRSFSNRKFNALAIDSNGRTNCITKYIRPLEPPQISTDEYGISSDQCARYISLISVSNGNKFFENLWLTSDQLIKYLIGTINDHAVTLTCFLLALKMDAWLLLGYGLPHGATSYVLVREHNSEGNTNNYYIYDAVTSDKYSLLDLNCPLQKVYCVVNGENIWGNIQRTDNIALTRFDLQRHSDWLPLFNEKVMAPTCFSCMKINYQTFETENLELRLEKKIRKKVAKLRQLDRTTWNHNVSSKVKTLLKSFEINAMYGKNNLDIVEDLKNCFSQYKVNGYLLNMPFTSLSDKIEIIKKTNIHVQNADGIEFSSALLMQTYAGNVISVWIFLAVLLDSTSSF